MKVENYLKIYAGSGLRRKEGRDGGIVKQDKTGEMVASENPIVDPRPHHTTLHTLHTLHHTTLHYTTLHYTTLH